MKPGRLWFLFSDGSCVCVLGGGLFFLKTLSTIAFISVFTARKTNPCLKKLSKEVFIFSLKEPSIGSLLFITLSHIITTDRSYVHLICQGQC